MGDSVAAYYNKGIHVVGADKIGEDGPDTGGAYTGDTRYSTAVEAPSGISNKLKDYR